ncbi:hypothetical protein PI125_g4559 [Phytophthora idaei]|nr:hypothetical protein PI125_g4559 [Phytophthora idaei]
MVVIAPLPRRGSPRRAHSCPDPGANAHASKKRRRLSEIPDTNEEIKFTLAGANTRPRGRPRTMTKTSLTATNEIRMLRAQVASMEEELQGLQSKWSRQIPDKRTLATAHRSAREKHAANQSDKKHKELQQLLRQQQLQFATLQTAVLHAPLHSSGSEIAQRALLGHAAVFREKFSKMAINKALAKQSEGAAEKSLMPLSQIEITGCKDCTLISEIPHTSLEEVYAAVLAYFDAIPVSMKKHFGVEATRTRLNQAESPVVYRRSTFDGSGVPATVNNIVCSELTASHGMVHIDAVTEDPLHPVSELASSQYGICGLTITPRKEPVTGKTLAVTLRWVVVYRYNMLPCDPAIKQDLEVIRPILNGDLITASVCSYIQQKHSLQTRSTEGS